VLAAEFPVNFKLLILQSLRGELSTTDYSTKQHRKVARKMVISEALRRNLARRKLLFAPHRTALRVALTLETIMNQRVSVALICYRAPSLKAMLTWLSTSIGRPLSR